MSNKKLLLNFEYSSLQGTYWMYYGAIYSFASAFLLSRNFSNSQIGLILALANILGLPAITFFSNLADKTGLHGTLKIGIGVSIVTALLTSALVIKSLQLVLIAILFISAVSIQTALQPLISALSFKLSDDSTHVSFGFARSMGSLSYSILCALLGGIVEAFGTNTIPISGTLIVALMIVSFLGTTKSAKRFQMLNSVAVIKTNGKTTGLIPFIKNNKTFVILCLGVVGLFFSNGILNSFLLQIVKNVGGNSKDMGYIFAVMAFLEVPTLIFFDQINKIFKYEFMLRISAICFVIKIALCAVAKNVTLLYIAHFLQPVAFALFLPAMVHYIDKIMAEHDAVKGQGLFTLSITISSVLASILGGFLIDHFGIFAMNFVATMSSLAGAIIIILIITIAKPMRR